MDADTLPVVIKRLRDGKAQLRRERINAPIEEKIQILLHLQRFYVDVVGSRRQLKPWQRPWKITNCVNDTVVISDGQQIVDVPHGRFSSSRPHWVQTSRRVAVPA